MKQIPCETPWSQLNRLLSATERFRTETGEYVLAPSTVELFAAARYVCHELGVTPALSTRSLKQVHLNADGYVQVEPGCSLAELGRLLAIERVRLPLAPLPWNANETVEQVVVAGCCHGIAIEGITARHRLCEFEGVDITGARLRQGLACVGASCAAGQVWGTEHWDIIPVSYTFYTAAMTEQRVCLSRRFDALDDAQRWAHQQRHVLPSLERLDLVYACGSERHCFVLAELSGAAEELAGLCPDEWQVVEDALTPVLSYLKSPQFLWLGGAVDSCDYVWEHLLTGWKWSIVQERQ